MPRCCGQLSDRSAKIQLTYEQCHCNFPAFSNIRERHCELIRRPSRTSDLIKFVSTTMSTESTTEQQVVADDPVVNPVPDKAPEENAADEDDEYVKCNFLD